MGEQEPIPQEHFMRLFIASEQELLRYIMATIPHVPDARDILQETAVALWRKMPEYDVTVPFTPWACRFAANEIRAFLRRERRHRRWLDEDVAELLRKHQEDFGPVADSSIAALRKCMDRLGEHHRQLLQNYYFDELGIEKIAELHDQTVEAAYKMLQRVRKILQDCVERQRASA